MKSKSFNILIVFALVAAFGFGCIHGSTKSAKNAGTGSLKNNFFGKVLIADTALKKLVDNVNRYLKAYDTLSPFAVYEAKLSGIPQKYLDTTTDENLSDIKGKISGSIPIGYYQRLIWDGLGQILSDKHITTYRLDGILDGKYIFISHSADRRLYSLSIDEKTGGSYKSQLTFVQYRAEDGKVYNYDLAKDDDAPDSLKVFNSDGFAIIADLHTPEGIKYLLQGDVMVCNTCQHEYVQLVKFKNGIFNEDFSYTLDTRGFGSPGGVAYDENARRITIDYKTDDRTPNRDCGDLVNPADTFENYTDDTTNFGKPCHCEFKFNGHSFVLDRKKSDVGGK